MARKQSNLSNRTLPGARAPYRPPIAYDTTPAKPPAPPQMISVEKSVYVNLTRRVRTLEEANTKLESYMKVIAEAARESQTRERVYSARASVPASKSPSRSYGNGVQQRNTGQVLRGDSKLSMDGVQVPLDDSTPHKLDEPKSSSKTKPSAAEVASEGNQ